MASESSLLSYRLEIEWMLTWFPIRAGAPTQTQRTRAGASHFVNTDPPFVSGNGEHLLLGQKLAATDESLTPDGVGVASITITVNQDEEFDLAFETRLGGTRRRKSLLAPPGANLPFMINVLGRQDDSRTQGTALSLHGTITTTKRPVDRIFAFRPGRIGTSLLGP